jgi:HD superfamily phosphohydrolase
MNQKPLIIRDEIHGDITLGWVERAVVDHPSFQRLRNIKQLGLAEYVFPCATHTRFQHSLGAAFLARQYFDSLLETVPEWDFVAKDPFESTEFLAAQTKECFAAVASDKASRNYWATVSTLAGMLHDLGHGPWSHTFEYLDLRQDFGGPVARLRGAVRAYFDRADSVSEKLAHEDISILYLYRILSDLAESGEVPDALCYFLPVALLIHKRMWGFNLRALFEAEVNETLGEAGVTGGTRMLQLLAPLISGPFDVDRADYIQRDGRNCGVSIGGIEWKRIVRKVVPCLARQSGGPTEVVLVSNLRNQHVLDDFIFSLFQMYAQVYLHPKIVAFEEEVRRELSQGVVAQSERPVVSFDLHQSFSDEGFMHWLEKHYGTRNIRATLFRQSGKRFQSVGLPDEMGAVAGLPKAGYRSVASHERWMLKDPLEVFLYSNAGEGKTSAVVRWKDCSPIANHFQSIRHSSEIWIRPEPILPTS